MADVKNVTDQAAASTIAQQALANAEPGKEAGAAGTTAIPGEGVTDSGPDSFASEDTALEALIAEQARLDAEAAAQAKEKPKEGETAAGSTGEVKEGDAAAAAAAKAKAEAEAAAAAAAAATDPQVRTIIALRKKLGETQGALLIKEGENRALKSLVDPAKAAGDTTGQPAGEPNPTEEALTAIETERETLAAKVDAGTMTMVEYTKEFNALARRERELVLAEAESMAQAAAEANARPSSDLGLDEATNAIITNYPVLAKLTKAQLDPINALAYEHLALEGKPITSESPSETKRLRERMADLAEQFYDPASHAARKAKVAAAPAGTETHGQKPAAAGNVTVLPTAAQREEKLRLAAEMPPEIGKTGAAATAGELTDTQIAAALNGNEDQRIAFMEQHPALIAKVMGPGFRVRR